MVEANLGEAHSPDYVKLSLCVIVESCSTKPFLGLIVCLVAVSSRGEDLSKIDKILSVCTVFRFHAIISWLHLVRFYHSSKTSAVALSPLYPQIIPVLKKISLHFIPQSFLFHCLWTGLV